MFDAGANTGVYAVQQARRGARVYAFEPNPDCYRRLRKAVAANGLEDRVTALNCALGAAAGSVELIVPKGLTTMGSLRPEWTSAGGGHGVSVPVDTIDRVASVQGIRRIDLLKVDVEGLEIDVLQGARETLDRVDRVVVEYHSLDLDRRVAEMLAQRGLSAVGDHKLYRGDESKYRGVGRGLLFAARHAGSSRRSNAGMAVA